MANVAKAGANDSPMMTPRETAAFLNLSINTVRRWSNIGLLKAYRISSRGDRRFLRTDVEFLLHHANELTSDLIPGRKAGPGSPRGSKNRPDSAGRKPPALVR